MKRFGAAGMFALLAFLIPLGCLAAVWWMPGLQAGMGWTMLVGLSAASPAVAALLAAALAQDGEGMRGLIRRCYRTPYDRRLCLVAIGIPVVEIAIAQGLSMLLYGRWIAIGSVGVLRLFTVAFALVAEELGWRGFLQARLERAMPGYAVPLVTGVLWALWHYHFYLLGSMTYPMGLFLLGCVADSVLYYHLTRAAGGNIVPASLLHCAYNLVSALFAVQVARAYALFVTGAVVLAALVSLRGIWRGRVRASG